MTGRKDDAGKPFAACLLEFPRALDAVAKVATFGAKKYTRRGWESVPNGEERYFDSAIRHLIASQISPIDEESGLPHLHHCLWNLMAITELHQRRLEMETVK